MYLTKKIINRTQFSEHIQISHWQQIHLNTRTEHEIVRYSKKIPTNQHNKKNGIIERTQYAERELLSNQPYGIPTQCPYFPWRASRG